MTSRTSNSANDPPRFTPLSLKPINFSLTDGTSIPAPLESPPQSPTGSTGGRPPTPGGGPLTSHPTTPEECMPGAFPPTPPGENEMKGITTNKQDVFQKPLSPASATAQSAITVTSSSPETLAKRRPSGVRRLLSINSLRSSFASSRASLALPSDVNTSQQPQNQQNQQSNLLKRPSSPSILSSSASTFDANTHNSTTARPELRAKRSASWFRRKSSLFFPSSDSTGQENGGFLDAVQENYKPESRESKKIKDEQAEAERQREEAKKAGFSLPEIRAGDGSGELGWDDGLFGPR